MSNIYSTNERNPEADNTEASQLLKIIYDESECELGYDSELLTNWEREFLESVDSNLARGWNVTQKQLFKLRDIKDKLL